MPEKDRGTYYKVSQSCLHHQVKGKEHLAVHCHGIRPEVNIAKTPPHFAMLSCCSVSARKHKKSMSKKGQNMVVAAQKLEHQSAADSSASSWALWLDCTSTVHCNTLHALSITLRI